MCEAVLVWLVKEVLAAQEQLLAAHGGVFSGAWRFLRRAEECFQERGGSCSARRSSLRRRRGLLGVWSSKEVEVGSLSFASGVEVLCMYSIFLCCLLVCNSVIHCALPFIELLGLFFHFGI